MEAAQILRTLGSFEVKVLRVLVRQDLVSSDDLNLHYDEDAVGDHGDEVDPENHLVQLLCFEVPPLQLDD